MSDSLKVCFRRPAQDSQGLPSGSMVTRLVRGRARISVHVLGINKVHGQVDPWLRQSWRQTQLQHSSGRDWRLRAELKWSLWGLGQGLWVAVPGEAGQGRWGQSVHPGPWQCSPL